MYHRLCATAPLTLVSGSNHTARSYTGEPPHLRQHVHRIIRFHQLLQVDVWCSQTQQRIVGYYQANACVSDSSPTPCALKIAEKIFEQCNNAVLLMIDGEKMFPGCRVPPIVMYERKDARWALKDKHTIMLRQWEETCSIVNQLFSSGDQTLLVDFDSHLDDITKDWTNQKLNAKIMELISPANGNV
uniref:ER membrane protein complex subunit 9 n=1 Tax=Cyprinus carpio carpio TaxID=630221 RepID=A0A8C1F6X9_CYPCA